MLRLRGSFGLCAAFGLLVFAPLGVSSCNDDGGKPPRDCPRQQPAFRILLTAEDGRLPTDTFLKVTYGSGTDTFSFAEAGGSHEDLCCRPWTDTDAGLPPTTCGASATGDASRDAGPDGGAGPEALLCDLWSNGVAELDVTTAEYPKLAQSLSAERDECGVRTVEVRVELRHADGGAPP